MSINDLLENSCTLISDDKYAGILGANPSQGARSPHLWNSAFKACGLESMMYPMDVSSKNLYQLLESLEKDKNFIGGAVAVPYKEKIASWLMKRGVNYITEEASNIGAVNSLYRTKDGTIRGTNTDGEAALLSLKKVKKNMEDATILVIGLGGAGKAIAAYMNKEIKSGQLFLAARNHSKVTSYCKNLNANLVEWPVSKDLLKSIDVLINCTILGSHIKTKIEGKMVTVENYTPLTKWVDDKAAINTLQIMKSDAIVFDIIYDPTPTKLLKLAVGRDLKILDGQQMNIEQAVLAFNYAVTECKDLSFVRDIMLQAKKTF
jgi:shikimate dehydrogenase